MSKIKSIYDMLNPTIKSEIQASARKYDGARLLKYTLMSKSVWSDLSIREVNELMSYGNISTGAIGTYGFLYGDNIINQ